MTEENDDVTAKSYDNWRKHQPNILDLALGGGMTSFNKKSTCNLFMLTILRNW